MPRRSLLLATALLAFSAATASAQSRDDVIAAPVLRANVTVSGDLVRIGDVIDNAGTSAQIAIYRAPDLGTTGSLPTAQVISALRAHQVIGVDTRDISANLGDAAGADAGGPGYRTPGCARAGTQRRPWRCRQPQPDLRSRRAGSEAGGVEFRRDAGFLRPLRAAQQPLRCHPRDRQRTLAQRRRGCALPAPRSRPSRPRCWRAASSATRC